MPLPKAPSIERIQKSPWGYVMMVLGGLVALFARNMFDNSKQQLRDKDIVIAAYERRQQQADRRCDSVAGFWQSKYLNEVDYNTELLRQYEDENRLKLKKPNQELIKAIKKIKNE